MVWEDMTEKERAQARGKLAIGIYCWLEDLGYGKKAIRDVFGYSESQMQAVLESREIPSPAGVESLMAFVKNTVTASL